jgi:hypothetical protein
MKSNQSEIYYSSPNKQQSTNDLNALLKNNQATSGVSKSYNHDETKNNKNENQRLPFQDSLKLFKNNQSNVTNKILFRFFKIDSQIYSI